MARYTEAEIIVANAAKEIEDGDLVAIGQGIPMAAGVLAKATHAPNCVILTEAGLVGLDPFRNPLHIADATCSRGYDYSCDMTDIFTTIVNRGLLDVTFLGVGQMDRFGNMNSTAFGDYHDFRMRMMGAGGAPEFFGYARKAVLTMRGGKFVEKVDYVSSPGYLDGGDAREKAGFPPGTGPKVVYGTSGVYRFDDSGEIYLDGIFPGHDLDEIKAGVPWELKVAADLRDLPPPTDEEIELIRRFAPEISAGRKIQMELSVPQIFKIIAGEG